jgi:RNA polymerase sigma factor (sigma-70 family)
MARKVSPARERIARNTFRTLEAFEEHKIKDLTFRETVTIGIRAWENWRSTPSPHKVWGEYECLDCGGRHDLPGDGYSLVCPHLPDKEAKKRATGFVELKLAEIKGLHPKEDVYFILDKLSEDITWWAERHPSWGRRIRDEYRHHPRLGELIAALEDTALPEGDNHRPPENAGELIYKHLPLVRRLAKARATTVGPMGRDEVDDSLYSDLENIGVEALDAAVRRFDPTRGVTFGAFVKQRVAGAMDNWLTRERIRTIADVGRQHEDGGGRVIVGEEFRPKDDRRDAGATRRHRTSTGGYREAAYISTSVRADGKSRLIPANRLGFDQAIEGALAKLNPRQREVYRGRVLSDPPVSRSVLAAKLGIRDDRQIPRIEQQARLKMAKLLKVSPP